MSDPFNMPAPAGLCPRCGAPLVVSDRFCPVCGAPRPAATSPRRASRRGRWLVLGSAVVLLAVLGVVAAIYFSAPERRADRPVSKLPSGPPSALAVRGATTPVIYAGNGQSMLISRDRGVTWQVAPPAGAILSLATSGSESSTLYAAGDSFWRDDGSGLAVVASNLPGGIARILAVEPGNARQVFAIGPNRTFLGSTDGGQHWALLGSETPANATSLTIGGSLAHFYVGTSADGVFASSDGKSWINASGFVNGALPTHVVAALVFDPASGDRFVGPTGATATGALYAGTDQGIFKSIDGGISWSAMPFHHPTVALAVGPPGVKLMIAADSAGNIYRSTDGGATWN
jgi:hypothetical protein